MVYVCKYDYSTSYVVYIKIKLCKYQISASLCRVLLVNISLDCNISNKLLLILLLCIVVFSYHLNWSKSG